MACSRVKRRGGTRRRARREKRVLAIHCAKELADGDFGDAKVNFPPARPTNLPTALENAYHTSDQGIQCIRPKHSPSSLSFYNKMKFSTAILAAYLATTTGVSAKGDDWDGWEAYPTYSPTVSRAPSTWWDSWAGIGKSGKAGKSDKAGKDWESSGKSDKWSGGDWKPKPTCGPEDFIGNWRCKFSTICYSLL